MTSDYEKLFTECLKERTRETLPPNCSARGWPVSKMCRLAGGCPRCYAELLKTKVVADFDRAAFERQYDRAMDAKMRGTKGWAK